MNSYIVQKGTNCRVSNVCGDVDYSNNLEQHPALFDHPDKFEIKEGEPSSGNEMLVYVRRSADEIQEAYKACADKLIREMNSLAREAGVSGSTGADMLDNYAGVLTFLREGHFGLALYRLSQKPDTGFTINGTDLNALWVELVTQYKEQA